LQYSPSFESHSFRQFPTAFSGFWGLSAVKVKPRPRAAQHGGVTKTVVDYFKPTFLTSRQAVQPKVAQVRCAGLCHFQNQRTLKRTLPE
jgi:hypothetical protein